jgi:hypothetical protein
MIASTVAALGMLGIGWGVFGYYSDRVAYYL